MQIVNSGADDTAGRLDADMATARAAVATIQAKLDRLLDLHLDGTLDADTFARRQGALVSERNVAEAHVVRLEARMRGITASRTQWTEARAFCERVEAELDALDGPEGFERRRLLIQTLLTDIIVRPDELELQGALPCFPATPPRQRSRNDTKSDLSLDVLDINVDILDFHADHVPHGGGDGVLDGGPGADHVDALCDDDVEFDAHRILAHGQAHTARGVMAPRE